ncbi:MAG: transglutaminase domain-containing protein [Deltaproteobacteria bacterium]|nr:transglutaminase domain-containing protein [Deltaproteobacteria bacterium]
MLLTGCLLMVLVPGGRVLAAKTAAGRVTMEFDLSAYPAGKEVKLWLPYPVSSQYQEISDIRIDGDFREAAVYTDRVFQTPILYARWDRQAASRHLLLAFTARRQEVVRRDFPAREGAWDPADYRQWLRPNRLGPLNDQVRKLAAVIVAGRPGVAARARAIYDWVCDHMYRDPTTVGCGKGDVCALLKRPGGKCTDINSVFVTLCRAAGVPAREIFGIRLGKKPEQEITKWQHCWAEFFLPGYGWVPVDPADVRKMMLKEKLKLAAARAKSYREYFWGAWDPYRVELARGRDLILNPPQAGEPLNTFGYPYAEVDGQMLDFYQPESFKYRLTCRRLP